MFRGILAFLLSLIGVSCMAISPLNDVQRWFILLSYDSTENYVSDSQIVPYDMAILDPDNHPLLFGVSDEVILIAYVSFGEAENYRSYWNKIENASWVLGENVYWQGNYYVDVRELAWRKVIIEEVIPNIIEQGFKGIMMDTLDTAAFLEGQDPEKYKGSKDAMADFVKEVHASYPDLLLISNNGLDLMPEIAPVLSGVLVEDINMMVDFDNDSYKPVPEEYKKYKVELLQNITRQYHLPIFVVDYISEKDTESITKDIVDLKKLGFKPYIAEKNLDRIYKN